MLFTFGFSGDTKQQDKFTELYRTYRYTMLYVARSILKDPAEAEDTVHDAFLKVLDIVDQIGEVNCSKTKSLLVIIVKNKAIDRYRREQKIEQLPLEDCEYSLSETTDSIEDLIISRLGYERLIKAIGTLGDLYKIVLELRYLHGYSSGDVGRILDLDPKTVNMRLYRGKNKLRQILEKEAESLV